jgi:hypothetical protein
MIITYARNASNAENRRFIVNLDPPAPYGFWIKTVRHGDLRKGLTEPSESRVDPKSPD